jgi:hypothetical protein
LVGFVVRKTFYDLWDNFLRIALTNLGAIVLAFGAFQLVAIAPGDGSTLAALAVFALVLVLYMTGVAKSVASISDYSLYGFRQFWKNLVSSLPVGFLCWTLLAVGILTTNLVIPFYLRRGNLVGFAVAVVLFYVMVLMLLVLLFCPAGMQRLEGGVGKRLQRTLAFVIDNLGFCFLVPIVAVVMLGLSVLLGFLWPGPAGVMLFMDEAMRLRLLKYDWLMANPSSEKRCRVPWRQLLEEEREMTGTRTWRNFIFPWKD